MKKISSLILMLVLTIFSFSQKLTKEEKTINKQIKDFEIFKTSLYELESNLSHHISGDSLTYYLEELEAICSNKIRDDKTLYKAYSKVLVKIKSGHTNLQPTENTYGYWIYEKNSLPMDVILVGRKLFTVKDYNMLSEEAMKKLSGSAKKANIIPKYTEILKINGETIETIMNKVAPYLSSDFGDESFKYYLSKDLFEFYRNLTNTGDESTEIEIEILSKRKTEIKSISLGYPPVKDINERFRADKKKVKKKKRSEKYGKFEILSNKYAYFTFNTFEKSKGKKYKKFLKESFETMGKKEVEYLVVDLRDNTGGFVQYDFLTYLFPKKSIDTLGQFLITKNEKPTYRKHIVKDKHYRKMKKAKRKVRKFEKKYDRPYNGVVLFEQLGRQKVFSGKIIVITNEATFSAASILAADLKNIYGAKIIGSEAGGSFHKGSTGNISVELPHSKFKVTFNPVYYRSSYSKYDETANDPDIPFVPEFKDPKKDAKNNQKAVIKLIKREFKKRD
ncbi:MAG: S41 family peptidase [Flavobacteriales bacterium]